MRRSKEEKNQMRMQCIPEQLCRLTVPADMLRPRVREGLLLLT